VGLDPVIVGGAWVQGDLSYRKSHLSRMNQINLADRHGMQQAGRLDLLVVCRDDLDCPLPSPQPHA
jgi:hypothetical protein